MVVPVVVAGVVVDMLAPVLGDLGGQLGAGQRRQAVEVPPGVDRLAHRLLVAGDEVETLQVDERRAVVRRAGRGQHARDRELLVVDVPAVRPAVDELELRADAPAVLPGDLAADDRVERPVHPLAVGEPVRPVGRVAPAEVLLGRADDREGALLGVVPEGDRRRGLDDRVGRDLLEEQVRQVCDRRLDAVDGAQDELHVAALRPDDQVVGDAAAVERLVDDPPDEQHRDDEHRPEGDAQRRQRRRERPLPQALEGDGKERHGEVGRW